jgi:hypothetical protein
MRVDDRRSFPAAPPADPVEKFAVLVKGAKVPVAQHVVVGRKLLGLVSVDAENGVKTEF